MPRNPGERRNSWLRSRQLKPTHAQMQRRSRLECARRGGFWRDGECGRVTARHSAFTPGDWLSHRLQGRRFGAPLDLWA